METGRTPLLGDPRNDENLMIAGLHCAHILFYNRVLDELSQFDLSRFPAARVGRAVKPGFRPFLGADVQLGPNLNPNITGNRTYTRAHFLYYAGVVTPGTYR